MQAARCGRYRSLQMPGMEIPAVPPKKKTFFPTCMHTTHPTNETFRLHGENSSFVSQRNAPGSFRYDSLPDETTERHFVLCPSLRHSIAKPMDLDFRSCSAAPWGSLIRLACLATAWPSQPNPVIWPGSGPSAPPLARRSCSRLSRLREGRGGKGMRQSRIRQESATLPVWNSSASEPGELSRSSALSTLLPKSTDSVSGKEEKQTWLPCWRRRGRAKANRVPWGKRSRWERWEAAGEKQDPIRNGWTP